MLHGTKEREGTLCSHARRACAEHPGPSWAPSAPSASNRFSCTSIPLSYHRTGSNVCCSLRSSAASLTSFSHIDYPLFLLPVLSISLSCPRSPTLFFFLTFSVSRSSLQTSAYRFKCGRLLFFLSATFFHHTSRPRTIFVSTTCLNGATSSSLAC